ncbi:integral membrane protein GPR137 [Corythoichthys intestinalis]|uniref:integral membrane protein GPR137 n=1 Tax=Corythoichthys intestinalis TaxID=161448 RepID=UPI0025A65A75|nr:integral membrane protein GPR137 [Corythoichthys intestinalis]XP_061793404.1 integral membrane protein GPR137-like [Nerophis lumbriciformis]
MEAPVTAAPPLNSSTLPTPLPLRPALPPSVRLGFTILYTVLYGGVFLVVYAQLWLLLRYRHKRWSYQSIFLFLSLLWAALRTTLFSFYFRNTLEANRLPVAVYWLFYCFPVCLQFFTLSLINLYFTQVLLKARETYSADVEKRLCAARCTYGTLNAIFLCVNVACAALADHGESKGMLHTWNLVLVRVLVNDLLFILDAVLLAALLLLLLLTRHSRSTGSQLTRKGTIVCRTATLGAAVIFLFTSRACYNLSVLFLSQNHHIESFGFDWYNVSDQADLRNDLGDRGYLAFGAILFIWELLPTTLLIVIFRVRRPTQEVNNLTVNNRVLPRHFFFDDPQGSSEEVAAPWTSTYSPQSSWYVAETTPLLFANNPPNQNHQHHSFYSTPQN